MPSRLLIYAVVFATSFAVMSLELSASRLLMPHFGASIFVWGTLISVILLALAVGYAVGGRMADRLPPRSLLAGLLLGAGAWVAAADWVAGTLLTAMSSLGVIAGTATVVALLFLVPMAFLGAMTPAVLKALIDDTDTLGATSGRVFFLSSLGSILGTLSTTFLFVPFVGTTRTIAIVAGVLATLGLVMAAASLRARLAAGAVLLGAAVALIWPPTLLAAEEGLLFEAESPYQFVRVVEQKGQRFLLLNSDRPFRSFNAIKRPEFLSGYYFDDLAAAPALLPPEKRRRVLVLGMGTGTVVEMMLASFPDAVIDGVELDPVVVEAAQRFFGLEESERLHMHAAGGRAFLQAATTPYDVIVVDVFQNGPYLPFHFATVEFFALAAERLAPHGVLAMNVEFVEEPVLNAIAKALPRVLTLRRGHNVIVYASRDPLTVPPRLEAQVHEAMGYALERIAKDVTPYEGRDEPLFHDDRAPVELLVALRFL